MRESEVPDELCNLGCYEKRIRKMLYEGLSRREICKNLNLTALKLDCYVRSINKKISLYFETKRKKKANEAA